MELDKTFSCSQNCTFVYLEVIRGVGVLITGDDLGSHPVRRPDKRVSPAHRAVQLSAHAKVH